MTNSAKSKIDLLPNNSSSFQGAARTRRASPARFRSGRPAVRWSVSSLGDHGSGDRWGWTHEDGSRTCLGAVVATAPWFSVVPGSTRCLQLSDWCCLAQDRILRCGSRRLGDGGDEETRTPDPLLAKEMLCQLSYVPSGRKVVGVSGLEPETSALSGQCSNQLS